MFALFFFVLFLAAVLTARDWYLAAKLFPFFAGIPGMAFASIEAWREITGRDSRTEAVGVQMDEQYDETIDVSIRHRRTIWFFSWLSATAVGI